MRYIVPVVIISLCASHALQVSAQESESTISEVIQLARSQGDANRGVLVFSSAKFACISCHTVKQHGGRIGPDLTKVGTDRKPEEIVESLLDPKKTVKPEYIAHVAVTDDGKQHRGYLVEETEQQLVLKDPSSGEMLKIDVNSIEDRREFGTLMPEGLTKAMTSQQLADVVKFLLGLGHPDRLDLASVDSILEHAVVHAHGPVAFEYDLKPLHPEDWPNWEHPVNRDRIYDFYAKQAEHFRTAESGATLLTEFPGLDGGTLGHWGNQNEEVWKDGRWNETDLGSLQSGVFRGNGKTVRRGICVRFGEHGEYSACFDPETLTFAAVWKDGFIHFTDIRHGFMDGLPMQGTPLEFASRQKPDRRFRYLGLYRDGRQVFFHYEVAGEEFLESPGIDRKGRFTSEITASPHVKARIAAIRKEPRQQWPQVLETSITLGTGSPYAVDSIDPPFVNPWNSLMFFGGHAFMQDGSALLCTMQGDVWRVSGFPYPSRTAKWKRFASGLQQPQGMWIDDDGIFVLGRDRITRLHDFNQDGEADYYESFCDRFETSPAGHDFICGLERDADGYFYTASGNQGLLQISPDGQQVKVLATGFRNPDGLGLTSDGVVTVPCSEGSWTPASMICAVPVHKKILQLDPKIGGYEPPFFGLGGPQNEIAPDLPMVYIPRGLDNSSGGQIEVDSDRWGPLNGQLLHFSFGSGTHFLLLRDEVRGQIQGGLVPLPGEFLSGAHRGRFNPADGQLYVSGMAGWGSYTPDDGSFQRVRYNNEAVQLPVAFHAHENGILLRFTDAPNDMAGTAESHFAQAWNYRYSPGYGSAEFSTKHYGTQGHDVLQITKSVILKERKSLFLEIPELQPVNQLHLRVHPGESDACDLFLTIHALDAPFHDHPGIEVVEKQVQPHPILKDVAYISKVKPNPWVGMNPKARDVILETGSNLTFKDTTIHVKAGEPLRFTLVNPDVVPHNWALIKPGTLQRVGDLANKLIADPDAFIRHYIPETSDVLYYTDIVQPNTQFVIFFNAPQEPGRYPYLCTFPGHWMVMNGEMIVE